MASARGVAAGTGVSGSGPSPPRASSHLEAQSDVVLRTVLVEGARLRLIQREVLERRVVQVHAIDGDREVLVHREHQRRRERTEATLRERRVAVEAAEELRTVV